MAYAAGSIVLLVFCYILFMVSIFYADDIEDWFNIMQTSRGLPDAQIRFDQIYNDIVSISQDVPLRESTVEALHVPEAIYTNCIRGRKGRIYGADQPFTEVVAGYARAFEEREWQHRDVPNLETVVFYLDVARVEIALAQEQTRAEHPEWRDYQTVYYLRFEYAEPRVPACSG